MSQLERKLLALMTTAEGMAEVVKSGLRREVFEEPIHRQVFVWMVNYWNKSGKAPTWAVMETEFPAVTLKLREECPVKESVEWLVRELDRRHSWGQLQDIAMKAAVTGCEDPTGALETLARDAKAAWEQSTKTGGDGMPRLWAAADLRPAEQPRWLARQRIPMAAVSLLVGDEGTGKSLFWVLIVAAVTTGRAVSEFGIPQREPGWPSGPASWARDCGKTPDGARPPRSAACAHGRLPALVIEPCTREVPEEYSRQ